MQHRLTSIAGWKTKPTTFIPSLRRREVMHRRGTGFSRLPSPEQAAGRRLIDGEDKRPGGDFLAISEDHRGHGISAPPQRPHGGGQPQRALGQARGQLGRDRRDARTGKQSPPRGETPQILLQQGATGSKLRIQQNPAEKWAGEAGEKSVTQPMTPQQEFRGNFGLGAGQLLEGAFASEAGRNGQERQSQQIRAADHASAEGFNDRDRIPQRIFEKPWCPLTDEHRPGPEAAPAERGQVKMPPGCWIGIKQDLKAPVERESVRPHQGNHAPARLRRSLQQHKRATGGGQDLRASKPGQPRPDDHHGIVGRGRVRLIHRGLNTCVAPLQLIFSRPHGMLQ